MLAGALTEGNFELAPEFPLMTRGWALIDELPAGEDWLSYARPRLGRTTWTTFIDLSTEAVLALSQTSQGVPA
jgi:hypothetical protein